jgi:PTH1 family peptidyl-tRNA hydrolase
MWLFAGLGNPGPQYASHRHNIGFMALDILAQRHRFAAWRHRFQGQTSEGRLDGEKVLLLKPTTFMNLSGQAVGEAVRFFKIDPAQVVILHDELDLPPGKMRIRQGGGTGGHNGLKSIGQHLGDDAGQCWRVRLGIGHPGDRARVDGHVLGNFTKADRDWLDPLLDLLSDHAGVLLGDNGASRLQNKLSPSPPKRPPKHTPKEPKAAATKPSPHSMNRSDQLPSLKPRADSFKTESF